MARSSEWTPLPKVPDLRVINWHGLQKFRDTFGFKAANNRGTSFLLTGRRSLVICGKYLLIDESHGVAAHVEFELRR